MSTIKDGGPAFAIPCQDDRDCGPRFESGYGGMSLRDYFAAKAMQAAATNPTGANGFTFRERAKWAYEQADAMLAARDQEPS